MSTSTVVAPILIVVAVIFSDVLCKDATNLRQSSGIGYSSIGNVENVGKPPQWGPNSKTTTPWPVLGPQPIQNRDMSSRPKPQNSNIQPISQQISRGRTSHGSNHRLLNSDLIQNQNLQFLNNERDGQYNRAQSNQQSSRMIPSNEKQIPKGEAMSKPAALNLGSSRVDSKISPSQQVPSNGQLRDFVGSPATQPSMAETTPQNLLVKSNGQNPFSSIPQNLFPNNTKNNQMISPMGLPSRQPSAQIPFTGNKLINMETGPKRTDSRVQFTAGEATDDELREFSEILLSKDINNAAKYVTVNYQGKTTSRSQNDEAPLPLLNIDQKAYSIPPIEKMLSLYNNYILESNINEHYTAQEKIEENNLLDTILSTPIMQFTRNFLIQKGKLGKDPKEFKDVLREIWFNMYSRGGGRIGSSGFEHIFLAEIKNKQVSGLHNWLYFKEEEAKNQANYLGYMKKIDLGGKGAILKYHFTFHDIDKPVGSMFIGTSPELEIAVYSTCFLLRADHICPLKMNGNRFIIRTFTYRYRGKNMIGSAFPEI